MTAPAAAPALPLALRRPVLTGVLNLLIVIAGVTALAGLELRELPQVKRGVITVTTPWAGASAELIDREITARIEGAVARVAGVAVISSASRPGRSRVVAELADGVDPDQAAVDLREAVARIVPRLPAGAEAPRVVKADDDARPAILLALTSDTRPATALTRLVAERIEDRLIALPGVADVTIRGRRDAVLRIEADLERMTALGLVPDDLRQALRRAHIDVPVGRFDGARQAIPVTFGAPVPDYDVLATLPVAPGITLGDLAIIIEGPGPRESLLRVDGEAGIGIGILRQPGGNVLALSAAVAAAVAEMSTDLPGDVTLRVVEDEADFVAGAVREVVLALVMATGIVLAVILAFLRQPRMALIPAVSLPVALVGTLAVLWALGFSINVLTLMALVLAAGLVVDDSIVVLENIARLRARGMPAARAAVEGTAQVRFAAIATTAVLIAVILPLVFLPGLIGGLFREFAVTLAAATAISTYVALTLVPMLAARLLPDAPAAREAPAQGWRARLAAVLVAAPLPVLIGAGVLVLGGWLALDRLPRELVPAEDRGSFELRVDLPTQAALEVTEARMAALEAALAPLAASGEVASLFVEAGGGGRTDQGKITLRLAPWEARRPQAEIAAEAARLIDTLPGLDVAVRVPSGLRIRGAGEGLRMALLGADYDRLTDRALSLAAALAEDPAFANARTRLAAGQPELALTLDRDRLEHARVAPEAAGEMLRAAVAGLTLGSLATGDRSIDLVLIAQRPVADLPGLAGILVPGTGGSAVALADLVHVAERAAPAELAREGQRRAVEIHATPASGLGLAEGLAAARALAAGLIDSDMRLIPLAEAATQGDAGRSFALAIGVSALLTFLALAAQFESPRAALAVMASVPPALAAGIYTLGWTGVSMNLYTQIGLLLLLGLAAKTAVLIVEFAETARRDGASPRAAIAQAWALRFRPVMMTLSATVLGALPLMVATGPGAEARAALGTVIAAGLGLATATILIVTPAAWLVLSARRRQTPT